MSIKTDSTPVEDPKDPDSSIIVEFYKLFASEADVKTMQDEFRAGGTGYGDFKKRLFEVMWEYFAPMREKRAELEANPDAVEKILKKGEKKARATAVPVLNRIRQAMGL